MINEIESWLTGLVEDDPIPYEIKHMIFFYTNANNCFVLKMGGFEILPKKVYEPDFFPLEAQFVFHRELLKIKDNHYFEEFGKSPQFLFNVN